MNKKDKDKLLILLIVIAYIVIGTLMIVGTQHIPWWGVIVSLAIMEYFVAQPKLCSLYYRANKAKAGWTRFIPFWNEIMMFRPTDAILTLISYLIVAASVGLFFIPASVIESVLGQHVVLNFGVYMIRIMAVVLILNCVIVGISFCHVITKVKNMHRDFNGTTGGFSTNAILYVFVFFPLLRTLSLINLTNLMTRLVTLNSYVVGSENKDNLVEEI